VSSPSIWVGLGGVTDGFAKQLDVHAARKSSSHRGFFAEESDFPTGPMLGLTNKFMFPPRAISKKLQFRRPTDLGRKEILLYQWTRMAGINFY